MADPHPARADRRRRWIHALIWVLLIGALHAAANAGAVTAPSTPQIRWIRIDPPSALPASPAGASVEASA